MKWLKLFAAFILILAASAFLAPWIHEFTGFRFERVLSRLVMVLTLVAVFLWLRYHEHTFEPYGLKLAPDWKKWCLKGFALGFMTLLLLTGLEVALGGREFELNSDPAWKMVVKTIEYVIAAFIIGLIEEFFFRGYVYEHLKRLRWTTIVSAIVTNVFYASVHFIKRSNYVTPEHPTYLDSFRTFFHLFETFIHFDRFWPSFIGLFLFGMVLSYAYHRTGSLYLSIGIHAGCVFFLKLDNWFVISVPSASPLIFGDKNLQSGILGWLFLSLMATTVKVLTYRFRKPLPS